MDFISDHLPVPPGRILDAGCGNGELADRLRKAGFHVTAIDIDPAHARTGVEIADICTYQDDPFDAVVFCLSLHHVRDVDKAVDRAFGLLKPGGRLIIDEFAYENADATIADRYFGRSGSLELWREKHRDFNTGTTMIETISRTFPDHRLNRVPYLYRYLEDDSLRDSESTLGFQLTATKKENNDATNL